MLRAAIFASALLMIPACASSEKDRPAVSDVQQIQTVLDKQKAAWNRGDIDGFMQGYLQSSDLRFASGGDVTRGWQSTSDRYKARYTDKATMGTLDFTAIETEVYGDVAVTHGRWKLTRANDTPSGLFTLILRDTTDGWKIISDTTTSAD